MRWCFSRVTPAFLVTLLAVVPGIAVAAGPPLMVRDIHPGKGGSSPSQLTNVQGTLFFAAPFGRQLYKSDGTGPGTILVKKINPNGPSFPRLLTDVSGTLFFAADDGTHGHELWKSDGSRAGTVLVKDINPGAASSLTGSTFELTAVGTTIFFAADDGTHGIELWKSDGTEAGTMLVKDINVGAPDSRPSGVGVVGETFLFGTAFSSADSGLWRSDGTDSGTQPLGDARPSFSGTPPGVTINGVLFFEADDKFGPGDFELWRSDGTEAGTGLVKDINPDGSASLSGFTNVNGTLFVIAHHSAYGFELWKSDGTEAGTRLVKDINPGSQGAYGSVVAADQLTARGRRLFFDPDDGVHGHELWKSDGTRTGTTLVKDINPGAASSLLGPSSGLTVVGTTVYFVANDATHGGELWKSDGTAAGTELVADINLGSAHAGPMFLTDVDGTLYFTADDGVHGRELWTVPT